MNKNQLIRTLQKKYPKMTIMEDGNGWIAKSEDSFVIGAEDELYASNGYDLLNYWTQNYEHWEFGVHNELVDLLNSAGWYSEWVNPGVLAVYKEQ